jgi:hypothetical protein
MDRGHKVSPQAYQVRVLERMLLSNGGVCVRNSKWGRVCVRRAVGGARSRRNTQEQNAQGGGCARGCALRARNYRKSFFRGLATDGNGPQEYRSP